MSNQGAALIAESLKYNENVISLDLSNNIEMFSQQKGHVKKCSIILNNIDSLID